MAYFHPWRRKVGILALLLACLSVAGWLRSLTKIDEWVIAPHKEIRVLCVSGYQQWGVRLYCRSQLLILRYDELNGNRNSRTESVFDGGRLLERRESKTHFERVKRFEFKVLFDHDDDEIVLLIPYWLIVIPMMAFSAYLLFSKPRVAANALPTMEIDSN